MEIDPFIFRLSIFILSIFIGYYVVWSVTPSLHTPLMSVFLNPKNSDFPQRVMECVSLLLGAHADVSLKNREGETAWDKAMKAGAPESVCVTLICNH